MKSAKIIFDTKKLFTLRIDMIVRHKFDMKITIKRDLPLYFKAQFQILSASLELQFQTEAHNMK